MRKSLFSLIVVLSICGAAVAAQTGVFEAPSYRLPGEFDRDAFGAEQQRLLTRLVAEQVEEGLATPGTIKLTEQEMLIAGEVLKEIQRRLTFLVDVGLNYLTLDRESGTLSG